jgi:phosphatidylinositol alpha-1,6-mannosyltransferase
MSNSHHTAGRVMEMHPSIGPVIPVPLGLLPAEGRGARDEDIALRVSPLSVAIVGRMNASERYKGHDPLLECWPAVTRRIPDAQLVIVGQGDDVPRLREKARALGVADRVLFTGFISDQAREAILTRVAAFAMPSRGEGFGLAYLEAMRAGVPCIGSTADAAGDVIVDGTTGFLIQPDDVEGLTRNVLRLLSDEEERRAMGEAGRARYQALFTYDRFVERLAPVLRRSFGAAGKER